MLKTISRLILQMWGWTADSRIGQVDKYVLIGAPHTTNWDFPLTLLGLSSMGIRFSWVAKHTVFIWPLGFFLRAIGGIPVDRRAGTAFLKRTIELYNERSRFILAIAPEGTRSRTRYWKTGFYIIARKAEVPIALGYVDYRKKQIGIGKIFTPSGDIEQDFELIRDFYRDKVGKFPENQGEVRIKTTQKKVGN